MLLATSACSRPVPWAQVGCWQSAGVDVGCAGRHQRRHACCRMDIHTRKAVAGHVGVGTGMPRGEAHQKAFVEEAVVPALLHTLASPLHKL